MLSPILVVAQKEILNAARDVRSVMSSLMYALMGPAVVLLISFALPHERASSPVLVGMASVFTLVAAFVGGMNIAMDAIAGERECRSLVPLLSNPVMREDIAMGKWLAIGAFNAAGVLANLAGFGMVMWHWALGVFDPVLIAGLLSLALLAASVELAISTVCRSMKEAQTYLSMVVFVPMLAGMGLVFFPLGTGYWRCVAPLVGQQHQFQRIMSGQSVPFTDALLLAGLTLAPAVVILFAAGTRLYRDDVVYGD